MYTGTLIAEITSVEDSFRIGVLIASATALNAENVTYHSTQFYCSGQTCDPPQLGLLLNLWVKHKLITFRIVANSSQHENGTMYAELIQLREEYFKHKQIVKFHHGSSEIAV